MEQSKIPVTVLTGFLGSGKTTLLNRILTENHGKRIAIIENEFGEVGVDSELVIGADEEIFEMNNGCICCTVRGDLIRILSQLTRRKDKLDHIIIETTGMANPSPVAQTFWVDEEMQEEYALDAIVTIVDAKHVWHHINDSDECKEQIAFADVLLLNKTDLVSDDELKKLKARIRSMNGQAKIYQTKDAAIDLNHILNINAFDLDAKVEMNPAFLDEEYPYEWSGYYKLNKGLYTFVFDHGPDSCMDLIVLQLANLSEKEQIKTAKKAIYQFSEREEVNYATLQIPNIKLDVKNQVDLREEKQYYYLEIKESGYYGLFTQHGPDEFNMQLLDDKRNLEPEISHEHSHSHEHDESVISVGIQDDRPLSIQKVNDWISFLLDHKGTDIYRMKGIMNIAGNDERFVFQGVHMLFDGKADREWKTDEKRRNQIIFIGKNLNREEILSGFKLCVA